ncbi:hypothetical protein RFI_00001 [Reticulomyxa filosa]|uniref:Uncharacterized protein n=1 Tax=Reticulomyxa filosa TaxID=46433 RepID=X6PGA2_RETFI|nr:hypothetical protein RFI_00001 [Reticulomyxa filosa]|eukprot:ETO37059.1 hypothetical protein RFI_00001 [Reticulomyxa filosa]
MPRSVFFPLETSKSAKNISYFKLLEYKKSKKSLGKSIVCLIMKAMILSKAGSSVVNGVYYQCDKSNSFVKEGLHPISLRPCLLKITLIYDKLPEHNQNHSHSTSLLTDKESNGFVYLVYAVISAADVHYYKGKGAKWLCVGGIPPHPEVEVNETHLARMIASFANTLQAKNQHKKQALLRLNHFIVVPGVCIADHLKTPIDYTDAVELLKFWNSTCKLIKNRFNNGVCEVPIYWNMNAFVPFNHLLATYLSQILNEKQRDLYFHIVSHGYSNAIDTITPFKRMSPEEFASKIDEMFEHCGLKAYFAPLSSSQCKDGVIKKPNKTRLNNRRKLIFEFHTCNSAYADVDESMDKLLIASKILTESFIGIFYNAMKRKHGYNEIETIGYRGFYQIMNSGNGARVGEKFIDPVIDIDCKQTQFKINCDETFKQIKRPSILIVQTENNINMLQDCIYCLQTTRNYHHSSNKKSSFFFFF